MYALAPEKQIQAVAALTEGCSIRATERLTGAHRDTIMRLGVRVGEGCARLHDGMMRNLQVPILELDEQWSFVGMKQKRVNPGECDVGDCYLFIALDATRKAVVSYVVGKRDGAHTIALVTDLRARITNRPQLTSDGWGAYPEAIDLAFAGDVDFATLVKEYATTPGNEAAVRYSPGTIRTIERTVVAGDPDPAHISTSYVERFNLTTRMGARRFTRLTNGFSKKLANHRAACALHVAHYNLCRYHETIRCTPAMALGVADHIWTIGELIDAALSAPEPAPLVPAPRKPMSAAVAKGEPAGTPRARQLKVLKGGRR
jgi:IS1 family transposase